MTDDPIVQKLEDALDPIRQVIVMRKDLNMRKGKMIAQGSHASIAFLTNKLRSKLNIEHALRGADEIWHSKIDLTGVEHQWIKEKFTKICLYVESENDLLLVHARALEAGLVSHLITDAGLTEFGGVPTNTCLAIGPDYKSKIDPITGHLPLL